MQGEQRLIFGAGAEYASYLEKGTIKMKPRSFLRRSNNENAKEVERLVGHIVFEELKK